MDAYGITDNGYVGRYYGDVVEAKRNRAIEQFGSSVDLTDNSIIGQFINATSYEEALIHQIVENVYYSRFVQFATGKALEDVVFAKGIKRKQGRAAIGEITIKKDATFTGRIYLPAGTIIIDMDGLYPYAIDYALEIPNGVNTYIDKDGNTKSYITDGITIPVTSKNIGYDYNVTAGKLCKLAKSIIGIASISNEYPTHDGENRESDDELRTRAIEFTQHSIGTKENILASIKAIEGVKGVNIREYFEKKTLPESNPYISIYDEPITELMPCSFVVCINGVNPENRDIIQQTVEDVRAYGIKAYCIKATGVPMNIEIKCDFTSSPETIKNQITGAVNDVLNSSGFGGKITYTDLLRRITALNDITNLTLLKFNIIFEESMEGEQIIVLEKLEDYIDMSYYEDSYLFVGNIKLNDIVTNTINGE